MINLRPILVTALKALLAGTDAQTHADVTHYINKELGGPEHNVDRDGALCIVEDYRVPVENIFDLFVELTSTLPLKDMRYFWHFLNEYMLSYIAYLDGIPPVQQQVRETVIRDAAWADGYEQAVKNDAVIGQQQHEGKSVNYIDIAASDKANSKKRKEKK